MRMALVLTIPDEILEVMKLPKHKAEKELKTELAFLLYEKEIASMGVARKLSGLTKWEFIEGLGERGIRRHYSKRELEEDIKYAKSGR
jgi:predicted HTH domain antitoxin